MSIQKLSSPQDIQKNVDTLETLYLESGAEFRWLDSYYAPDGILDTCIVTLAQYGKDAPLPGILQTENMEAQGFQRYSDWDRYFAQTLSALSTLWGKES